MRRYGETFLSKSKLASSKRFRARRGDFARALMWNRSHGLFHRVGRRDPAYLPRADGVRRLFRSVHDDDIESHLDSHLTIEAMANRLAVSPSTFTRRFRDGTGQSFNHYLTKQRMKGAVSLLRDTDLAVVGVAERVGLRYERLRDLFQQQYGCSPGEFRKWKK